MQTHQKRILKTLIAVALIAAAYYIFVRKTGYNIPCLFNKITGLNCPGCGISLMCMSLAKLKITQAYEANRFLFITLPFIGFETIWYIILKWKSRTFPKWNETVLLIYAALLIIWGIVRNILGI